MYHIRRIDETSDVHGIVPLLPIQLLEHFVRIYALQYEVERIIDYCNYTCMLLHFVINENSILPRQDPLS